MLKNRSKCLLASNVVATLYFAYLLMYFTGAISENEVVGSIATALVTPHMVTVALGVIFGWVSFGTRMTWAALTSAILYCVAAVLFLIYAVFLIVPIVLGFIGYAKQKKINRSLADAI